VERILTSVVLPAPFEPSRAKMLPRATSRSMPRSTSRSPNDFSRPCTWIVCVDVMDPAWSPDAASRSSPLCLWPRSRPRGLRLGLLVRVGGVAPADRDGGGRDVLARERGEPRARRADAEQGQPGGGCADGEEAGQDARRGGADA